MPAFAGSKAITITPVEKISTTDKNLHEGDVVTFREIESDKTIQGVIRKITPNGFMGQQAYLLINSFEYTDSKQKLQGQIYLKGNEHKKYQDAADGGFAPVAEFIRGGEVILYPDKTKLTLFINSNKQEDCLSLKITPAEKITTCYDEIEVGDKIKFYTKNDVYKNNKLYIKKGSTVYGIVDYVSENGWGCDNAQIDFKIFKVKTVDGSLLTIKNPISINGFEILKYKGNCTAQFFNYIGVFFRGKEVEIIPEKDNIILNLWIK